MKGKIEKIKCIFEYLIKNVEATDKEDVLNTTTRENFENRVYTKKAAIDEEFEQPEGASVWTTSTVKFVSVSSTDKDTFLVSDLRFSIINSRGEWCNLFAREVDGKIVDLVYKKLIENEKDEIEEIAETLDSLFRPGGVIKFKDLEEFMTVEVAELFLKVAKKAENKKLKGLGV